MPSAVNLLIGVIQEPLQLLAGERPRLRVAPAVVQVRDGVLRMADRHRVHPPARTPPRTPPPRTREPDLAACRAWPGPPASAAARRDSFLKREYPGRAFPFPALP